MSLQDLGSLGEFIGAVAVVASLLYVAIQLRQNTTAMHMSSAEKALDNIADFNRFVASDEQLVELWYRAQEHPESLSEAEHRRFMSIASSLVRPAEFVFFLYSEGHFPDKLWQSQTKLMRRWGSSPGYRHYVRLSGDTLDDGFRRYLEEEIFPHADRQAEARRSWDGG